MTDKDAAREYASQWASNPNYVEVAEDSFRAGQEQKAKEILEAIEIYKTSSWYSIVKRLCQTSEAKE